MRARFEPAHRWMPTPKVAVAVLRPVEHHLVGSVPLLGVAVGGGERTSSFTRAMVTGA